MLRGVLYATPRGHVALAALDEGEVNGIFVGPEIVRVADAVGGTARATVAPFGGYIASRRPLQRDRSLHRALVR